MGKNTDAKVKKVIGDDKLKNISNNKKKPEKPAIKKATTAKVVTEESESHKVTVFLIVAFFVFGGLGVYFKFFHDKKVIPKARSITELFGEKPNPDDKMLKPHKVTLEEIFEYQWTDNPIALTQMFDVNSIVRGENSRARIVINLPEYQGKRIPWRRPGDMLTVNYKIIDIQYPVIFLSDKNGKLCRLVERNSWDLAAEIYDWKPDLFDELNEELKKVNIQPEYDPKIVFGEYYLVDANEFQIKSLREWCDANIGYKWVDFDKKCKELSITYELRRPTAFGGDR